MSLLELLLRVSLILCLLLAASKYSRKDLEKRFQRLTATEPVVKILKIHSTLLTFPKLLLLLVKQFRLKW